MELPFESDAELILELVQLPHWAALKRVIGRREEGLRTKLLSPARTFPDDFYIKEQHTSELRAYRTILVEVEKQADKLAKKHRS